MTANRLYSILFVLLASTVGMRAQISEGGTPLSLQPAYGLGTDHIPTEHIAPPSAAMIQQMEAEDASEGKNPRIGVLMPANLTANNSGEWQTISKGGDRVWRLRIRSEEALGLTLYWSDFHLPAGAKLFVFTPDQVEVYGAFTAANNDPSGFFATQLVHYNELIVEYFEPAEVAGQGSFTISDVAYAWRHVKSRTPGLPPGRDFGDSGACEVNVNCSPEGNNWQDEKRGVSRYLVVVGAGQGWCTGTMVNNARQDCTPYFLTAWHCGEGATAANFNQWVFYFNYEAPTCANPANGNNLPNNTMTGCAMRANSNDGGGNSGSDFLLVQLNQNPPAAYNLYYCGWNATGVANTGGVNISHPAGDIKKISTYTNTLISATWGGQVQNTHWTANWVATANGNGVTEGGSSGSALFDNNGRIVGTLTGGPSNCNAAAANRNDQFGKVSYHWQSNGAATNRQLKPWLDPDNTGALTLDGVYAPCTGFTLAANPTAITACAGANATSVITVNALGGFNTPVNLTASGAAGATFQFSTNPVTPGNTSIITISGLAAGNYNVTVTGTAGATPQTVVLQVAVSGAAPGTPVLTTPVNAANGVANQPTLNWNAIAGATYQVQVATDAAFTNIVATATGLATNSWTVTPVLSQNTTYYWRVRASNGCGQGNFATAFSFTTGSINCVTVNSTNVPVTITAAGTPTITSTLSFPNAGSITDVNVTALSGTHSYISDLTFTLTSPAGTSVTLMDQICNAENNFNIRFDDVAAGTPPCPPIDGLAYPPNQPLAGFNGQNPQGTWTLTVTDGFNQDGGALQAWGIEICYVGGGCNLTATATATNVTCNGAANGAVTVVPTGGTAPYFYTWNNGATTASLSNLAPGAYVVTVTDANSCTATASASITQPTVFNVSFGITNTPPGACTGALTANTTGGGGGPFTYLWSTGATTQAANNLCAGTYTVTVTSVNGCTVSGTGTVNVLNTPLVLNASATPATCFGVCNGSATVGVTGGVPPYTYAWSNGGAAQTAGNLCAGSYTVTVTGANGNSATATAQVAQPNSAPTATLTLQPATALNPPCDGSATVLGAGGTPSYTYAWSNGETSSTATGLCGNQNYSVTLTDANGCTATAAFTAPYNPVGVELVPGLSVFNLSPNPNGGIFVVEAYFDQRPADAVLEVFNATGQLLRQYPLTGQLNRQEVSLAGFPSAVYFVRLKTALGTAVKPVIVR